MSEKTNALDKALDAFWQAAYDQGHFGGAKKDKVAQDAEAVLRAAISALFPPPSDRLGVTYTQAECDEMCEIAERDGYEKAVQDIDQLTGGDGEYRYCLGMEDSDRHTPDAPAMIRRIVDRFEVLNLLDEASKDGRDQDSPPASGSGGIAPRESIARIIGDFVDLSDSQYAKMLAYVLDEVPELPSALVSCGNPAAAYTVDHTGCDHLSRDVEGIERIAAAGSKGATKVVYLYAAPAPATDVDAEIARLRAALTDANFKLVELQDDLNQARRRVSPASGLEWRPMSTAPLDGKHCILSIPTGSGFIYSIQGAFMNGKWMNAANVEAEPLAWMPNILLPNEFCPWTDEYKSRAATAASEGLTE